MEQTNRKRMLNFAGLLAGAALLVFTGCHRIEGGFRYEYDGRILQPDGKTPAKGVGVKLARVDAPETPDLSGTKAEKAAGKYADKVNRVKSGSDGRFYGAMETISGWHYEIFVGTPIGSTQAPEPPPLPEVILYIHPPGKSQWVGYRVKVPLEAQTQASPRYRKLHMPDFILPESEKSQTRPATTQSSP